MYSEIPYQKYLWSNILGFWWWHNTQNNHISSIYIRFFIYRQHLNGLLSAIYKPTLSILDRIIRQKKTCWPEDEDVFHSTIWIGGSKPEHRHWGSNWQCIKLCGWNATVVIFWTIHWARPIHSTTCMLSSEWDMLTEWMSRGVKTVINIKSATQDPSSANLFKLL